MEMYKLYRAPDDEGVWTDRDKTEMMGKMSTCQCLCDLLTTSGD